MFIEARRSGCRTPAGCYVGHSHSIVGIDQLHRTPLGCRSRNNSVSINMGPQRGAMTCFGHLPGQTGSILHANDKLQPGPDLVNRADLHID